jgi:hypothetical protein
LKIRIHAVTLSRAIACADCTLTTADSVLVFDRPHEGCACIVLAWVITKSWILNDILAMALCTFFLANIRLSSIKVL